MLELLKKTILIGAGIASITKDKLEELTRDLVRRGELSEKEGRDLVQDLLKKSKEAKKELETRVEKIAADALSRMNIPTRKEIQELREKIERLEREKVREQSKRDKEQLEKDIDKV